MVSIRKQLSELHKALTDATSKHDALVEALTRIDQPSEMQYLSTHYGYVVRLLRLRNRNVQEEDIVTEHTEFSSRDGIQVPARAGDRKLRIYNYSPFYLATHRVQFREFQRLRDEAHERLMAEGMMGGSGWDEDLESPDGERVQVRVYYTRVDGTDCEHSARKSADKTKAIS